jgi:hypothetical protein
LKEEFPQRENNKSRRKAVLGLGEEQPGGWCNLGFVGQGDNTKQ